MQLDVLTSIAEVYMSDVMELTWNKINMHN